LSSIVIGRAASAGRKEDEMSKREGKRKEEKKEEGKEKDLLGKEEREQAPAARGERAFRFWPA
jgi:hypothetical protein